MKNFINVFILTVTILSTSTTFYSCTKEQTSTIDSVEVMAESNIIEKTHYAIPIPNDISDEDIWIWIDSLSDVELSNGQVNYDINLKLSELEDRCNWVLDCFFSCRCDNFQKARDVCYIRNICTGQRIFCYSICYDIYC